MTMAATRLMLGSAILGLFWTSSSLPRLALANNNAPASSSVVDGANGNGRCNSPPCTCDHYGRLTCDCKDAGEELILTAEGEHGLGRHTSRIVVTDCPSVVLANHSLVQMNDLISIDLVNVGNLTLMSYSFKLSPAQSGSTRITVRNSSMEVLPSNVFHGNVEAIVLENVRIGQVLAFAFANLMNTNSITLENCRIEAIQALAFKKFDVRFLHVIGGTFGDQVPSRAMNDIEVYDKFMLNGVKLGTLRSSAFIIKRPKTVAILNCVVDSVESEAFDVSVRGTVLIKNNTFGGVGVGAFLSIRADTENRLAPPNGNLYSLMFKNNSLKTFEEGSLIFDRTSFRTELSNVLVNQVCDCTQLSFWKSQILNYTNAYSRLISSRDHTSNIVAPPYSLESNVEDPETFLCLEDQDSGVAASFVDYEARNCALSSSMLLLIVALSSLGLFLIIVTCLAVYCCRRRRRDEQKRWISVPTSAPDVVTKTKNGVIRENSNSAGGPVDSRITMVVPDGRLYRETEFHVIVEKAEPLTTEL